MASYNDVIFANAEQSNKSTTSPVFWVFSTSNDLLSYSQFADKKHYLTYLMGLIQAKPMNLTAHMQRIYSCYFDNASDPLYAALLDLLIVLNNQGSEISNRMIKGSISKLTDHQKTLLKTAMTGQVSDLSLMAGNGYSLFTKGLIGTVKLIETTGAEKIEVAQNFEPQPQPTPQQQPLTQPQHSDPLLLAEYAAEYSEEGDDAMSILENAIIKNPSRFGLHESLLDLYKSTANENRFQKMHTYLKTLADALIDDRILESWAALQKHFDHK
jgi:hypothetical protein